MITTHAGPDVYPDESANSGNDGTQRVIRRVSKMGVGYGGRYYWHPDLAPFVSETVLLKVDPASLDEIAVFTSAGDRICTAVASDTSNSSGSFTIDTTQLDVEIQGIGDEDERRVNRPWLTVLMDNTSRQVKWFRISSDRPNDQELKALVGELHESAGEVPQEIRVDNSLAPVVNKLTEDLAVKILAPHHPQRRGRIERFFRAVDHQLLKSLSGYTGINKGGEPGGRMQLTLDELQQLINQFLDEYQKRTSSEDSSPETDS